MKSGGLIEKAATSVMETDSRIERQRQVLVQAKRDESPVGEREAEAGGGCV